MGELDGKVAVITSAGSGMARASTRVFVDAVLNVAGIGGTQPLAKVTMDEYDRIMAVDLKGVLRVVVAERGREFSFVNCGMDGQHEIVRWGFTLQAVGSGQTEVTQTWEILPAYVESFLQEAAASGDVEQRLDGMKAMAETGMPETLAKLKAEAERTD